MRILTVCLSAGLGFVWSGMALALNVHGPTLAEVIYNDCMPVHIAELREEGKDNPDVVAHFVCTVISGICRDDPGDKECRKGISAYDRDRKNSGSSELFRAAEAGNTKLVAQLIEIGFDPNAPLGPPGWTPLMIASANGHRKTVFSLLSHGADVNAVNDKGRTYFPRTQIRPFSDFTVS